MRISKIHWDLAKDHLDGLHVKMTGIQFGFSEIAWGCKGQWWGGGDEDCKSVQLRDLKAVLLSDLRTSDQN